MGASVVAIILLAALAWGWKRLERSLPQLDGARSLPGLSAAVTVERDALGIPTLTAGSREDLARATGFVHAQDRFFQMDLLRRRSAGELAELFGAAALPLDRRARLHEFRSLAGRVVAALPGSERTLLIAYAEGVNHALGSAPRPWEYELLRLPPVAWRPEDTILCIYSMALDLQDHSGNFEQALVTVRETLGASALAFFAPRIGPEDAALDGTIAPLAPIPSERALNLRSAAPAATASDTPTAQHRQPEATVLFGFTTDGHRESKPGSNSFGVEGALAGGAALLENDMHLGLSVPNVWYHARFRWTDAAGVAHDLTGATFPGTPAMAVGSNRQIAWGFTASYTDTGDLVRVQPDAVLPEAMYLVEGRPVDFERRRQIIRVKGGEDDILDTRWTRWGPIIGESPTRHPLAYRWTFHDPAAVNLRLVALETARSVDDAIAAAHEAGVPPSTSSSLTATDGSPGRSRAACPNASATTAGCPFPGPTAIAGGRDFSRPTASRSSSRNRATSFGPRTNASSEQTPSISSGSRATTRALAPAASAIACANSRRPTRRADARWRRLICWLSRWMTGILGSTAGRRSSSRASTRRRSRTIPRAPNSGES